MKNQTSTVLANIFSAIPEQLPEELFECLLRQDDVLIERIVSRGHITPEEQWYDQASDEWLIVLQGQAMLRYEKNAALIQLTAGDYLLIPAHTKHRVEWTPPGLNTIWLAIHIKPSGDSSA